MRIELLESAQGDLVAGYWFYERQERGLGNYFADTIYGEIESLQLYAGIHARHFGMYRAVCHKFPYSIYYEIEEGVVRVYGILDNRRDPKWNEGHLKG